MKNKGLYVVMLFAFLAISCSQETKKTPAITEKTEEVAKLPVKKETASFSIKGMTCEMGCAKMIESKLKAVDGVAKIVVNFKEENATISFDANKITTEDIVQTVEKVGGGDLYNVTDFAVVTQ